MRDIKLANRYAKTLFEISQKRNILAAVSEQAIALAKVIKMNEGFSQYLNNPVISSAEKISFFKKTLKDLDATLLTFIELVAKKKRLPNFLEILECFETIVLDASGIKKATIVSAIKLSETQIERITESLSKKINSKLKISTKVEPDLIGGFYAKIGDEIIDITIKSKLEFIEKKLLSVG